MAALKADDLDALIPIFACAANASITDLAGLVIRNINRFVTRDFYIGQIKHVKSLSYHSLAGQKLSGDENFYLALADDADEKAFSLIADHFSGDKQNDTTVFAYQDQTIEGDFHILPVYIEDHRINLVIADNDQVELGDTPYHFASNEKQVYDIPTDSRGSVLVVDDSRMSRMIMKNLLEEEGYSVIGEATNGEEAIEMFKQHPADLTPLDISMPKMVLKHYRRFWKLIRMPRLL